MKHQKLKFEKLLEEYVYNISVKIIDLVDGETQASLIRLFTSINKELSPIVKQSKAEVKAIKQLIVIHQIAIEITLSYISRVDKLLEKAKKISPSTARNMALIASYLSLKNRYSVALINAQALQQKDIDRLQ